MWTWKHPNTGATGECTNEQRLRMISDPATSSLQFVELTPKTLAQKPIFDAPERAIPKKPKPSVEPIEALEPIEGDEITNDLSQEG